MLILKPNCENCNKRLPADSPLARICTFECTFCASCADALFHNVCPNCGGGFSARPIRPKAMLAKYPASLKDVFNPVTQKERLARIEAYKNIDPRER